MMRASTFGASGTFRKWTFKIFSRPNTSGFGHHDLTVETAGSQERRVQNIGTVGRGNQNDTLVRLEAVHLDQQLVQRLFAFVVAAAKTGAAMTTDGVDFIDEHQTGSILLRLLEHVAHARCADTNEHFDEFGTGNREERHIRFAGDGTGQQRLTGTRRADQQHALRYAAAEPLEFLWIAQEFDDFFELLLGLVDAGYILERDAAGLLRQQTRPRFAEAHGAAATGLHLAHEENPNADQQQDREPVQQHREQRRHAFFRRLRLNRHFVFDEFVDEVRVIGRIGDEIRPGVIDDRNLTAFDRDFLDVTRFHLVEEGGIRNRHIRRPMRRSLK